MSLQLSTVVRLTFPKDRCDELIARFDRMTLSSRSDCRVIARLLARRNLKTDQTWRKGQRTLNGVVGVKTGRFARKADRGPAKMRPVADGFMVVSRCASARGNPPSLGSIRGRGLEQLLKRWALRVTWRWGPQHAGPRGLRLSGARWTRRSRPP